MNANTLQPARQHFLKGMSRISHFWGFPKAMGAIYGAIYLSPAPLSLDDLVNQVGVTKGAVSTNVRHLERLGMVHKHLVVGERKDYYSAETDFWKIGRGLLEERQQSDFDRALQSVGESLAMLEGQRGETADFARERLLAMQEFFNALDALVNALLKLENLGASNALAALTKTRGRK